MLKLRYVPEQGPEMRQTVPDLLALVLGIGLIVSGALALVRGRTRASAEFEEERDHTGLPARALGVLWVVLGVMILAGILDPLVLP